METAMINAMCRCCASEGAFKDVKSRYHWMGEEEIYADMLKDCFDVELSSSEGGDGGICEVCITQLRNAVNFKKQVLHTEEQFKKHVQNKLFKPNIVKVEVTADDGNDSDDNLASEDVYSGPEFEIPIKTEVPEEPKSKKRSAASKATTSRAKKSKTEDGETSTKRGQQEMDVSKTKIPSRTDNRGNKTEMEKHHVNIREILLSTNATVIQNQTDVGYTCCYCNAKFKTSSKLKKHNLEMHKDENVIPLEITKRVDRYILKLDITDLTCKLCDSRIDTLSDIVDHLMNEHKKIIHTDISNQIIPIRFDKEDQRSIYCGICGESFFKLKLLQVHMNLHLRNYVCETCDQGYIIKNNLTRHHMRHENVSKPRLKQNKKESDVDNTEKVNQHMPETDEVAGQPSVVDTEPKSLAKKCTNRMQKLHHIKEEMKKHHHNITEIMKNTNATGIHRDSDMGFSCCFCTSYFPNPADLKQHNLENHTKEYIPAAYFLKNRLKNYIIKLDITEFRCKLCDNDIDSLDMMFSHLQTEHKRTIHTDIECRIFSFKFNSDTFRCCICQSAFDKFKTLQEHMHTHYRNHICEVCESGYATPAALAIHHSCVHKTGIFKCTYCPKVYETHTKKNNHEKVVHGQYSKRNRCSYCSERFSSYFKKYEHLAEVHGVVLKKIGCRACDRTFINKRALTIHTRRDHLMERKYKCDQCESLFFSAAQLRMHEVKHTSIKDFQCEVCSKSYSRKKTLTEHMKIHNNVRRFKCEICGQAFVQKCSWKGHMRNRHGDLV